MKKNNLQFVKGTGKKETKQEAHPSPLRPTATNKRSAKPIVFVDGGFKAPKLCEVGERGSNVRRMGWLSHFTIISEINHLHDDADKFIPILSLS